MPEVILDAVSVDMPIYGVSARNLKGRVARLLKREANDDTVWVSALSQVSLQLGTGQRLGLVGANGAGKTTLLRVIAGILEPATGTTQVTGSVAAMFDLGLGMDYEATGRENIYLRGLMLGHSRDEMAQKVDAIVDFAGLGGRTDHPVRTYSSGMTARLAFSIATSIDPEILLIDEGIGMADAEFTHRAEERLTKFVDRAGIVVLASHSEALIQQFCNQALVLDRGRVVFAGTPADALAFYHNQQRVTGSG